jgi:hypothetical protein
VTDRFPLYYSVVRFAARPERDEARNLGIIAISEDGTTVTYRFLSRYRTRIRTLDAHFDPELVDAYLEDVKSRFPATTQANLPGTPAGTLESLRDMASKTAAHQIQLAEPRMILTADPQQALNQLFGLYVASAGAPAQRLQVTRGEVRNVVRKQLTHMQIPAEMLHEHQEITGQKSQHNILDFAIGNGHIQSAIHALTFDADRDSVILQRNSLAFAVDDIRAGGPYMAIPIVVASTDPTPSTQDLYEETKVILKNSAELVPYTAVTTKASLLVGHAASLNA